MTNQRSTNQRHHDTVYAPLTVLVFR